MKLAVHELESARDAIADDRLPHAFKMLARVSRILEQLNSAWDVLRTLTPSEYTEFREDLGQSSGFQSHQYRAIEFLCGNRNAAMLKPHAHRPEIVAELQAILARPSLYDEAIRLLGAVGVRRRRRARRPGRTARRKRQGPGGVARDLPGARDSIGRSTNSPRSWSTSRIISAAGASTTSPRSSA